MLALKLWLKVNAPGATTFVLANTPWLNEPARIGEKVSPSLTICGARPTLRPPAPIAASPESVRLVVPGWSIRLRVPAPP